MFLRKLLGSNNDQKAEAGKPGPPAGMQTMGASLQRKFARGVQYNMKIIIKGDRNVGKSCVFYRLQGQKFKEEYIPTEEIQVASIQWNYKATDDIVKVEVWDVVDKGKKKKKLEGLKLENQDGISEDACLDAEFIDVYKGTHGVIMVMDITKQWTFEYIVREIMNVPSRVPVLVLANHRDMGHHRTVSEDKIRYFVEELDRGDGGAAVRYAETSMRNGFGLKYIHKFFNLPFLHLQRETLMRQLATNMQELEAVVEELDLHEGSEEHDYDIFLDSLTSKRREQQEKLAEKALTDAKKVQDEAATKAAEAAVAAAAANKGMENGIKTTNPPSKTLREAPPPKPIKGLNLTSLAAPLNSASSPTLPEAVAAAFSSPASTATTPLFTGTVPVTPVTPGAMTPGLLVTSPAATTPGGKDEKQGFMSRWFGKKDKSPRLPDEALATSPSQDLVQNVEDFVPEEGLDASFLDDTKDVKASKESSNHNESESDEDAGNPMVAGFQEDLDSDDEVTSPSNPSVTMATTSVPSKDYDISSEEEEQTDDTNANPVIMQDKDIDSEDNTDNISNSKNLKVTHSSKIQQTTDKSKKSVSQATAQPDPANLSSPSSNSEEEKPPSPAPKAVTSKGKSKQKHSSRPAPTESFPRPNRSDDSDEEVDHHVTILGDLDYSDGDEEPMNNQPVITVAMETGQTDSGIATSDTTQENDGSQTSSEPKQSVLEFEDLSILERGLTTPTSLPRVSSMGSDLAVSSSRADTDTDLETSISSKKKKKHKHKDKDKEKSDNGHRRSKHKKHKEKDKEDNNGQGDALKLKSKEEESKDKKKKKKSKKREDEQEQGMNELEAFLGSDLVEPPGGAGGYESL